MSEKVKVPRFKKPSQLPSCQYTCVCWQCYRWEYRMTMGCANLGICWDKYEQRDAYAPPCLGFVPKPKKAPRKKAQG